MFIGIGGGNKALEVKCYLVNGPQYLMEGRIVTRNDSMKRTTHNLGRTSRLLVQ